MDRSKDKKNNCQSKRNFYFMKVGSQVAAQLPMLIPCNNDGAPEYISQEEFSLMNPHIQALYTLLFHILLSLTQIHSSHH